MRRQAKNRIKHCLEGGSSKPKSGLKVVGNENDKNNKVVRGKVRSPNYGELGHRKNKVQMPT